MTACKACNGRGWGLMSHFGSPPDCFREECSACHGTGKDPQATAVLQAQRAMIAALYWQAGEHACLVTEYAGRLHRRALYHVDLCHELLCTACDMEEAL